MLRTSRRPEEGKIETDLSVIIPTITYQESCVVR